MNPQSPSPIGGAKEAIMTTPLTAVQSGAFRTTLRARFDALCEEVRQDMIKADDDRAALLGDGVRDLEDESLADLIVDLDLADTDRDLEELRAVQLALERVSAGTYGICSHCRTPIPEERLQANPAAERCEPCERIHELTYRHKGTPTL